MRAVSVSLLFALVVWPFDGFGGIFGAGASGVRPRADGP